MPRQAIPVDTFLAIASRRDERRYSSAPLPPEVVQRILDAGRLSGSSRNRQPWTFVVVEGREPVERVAETVFVPGNVRSAGLVIGILVSGKGPTSFDAGRAAQNMLLAAWNEGVSACPNGIADPESAAAALGAVEDERPVIVLSFGLPERRRDPESRYAEEWSARANRRSIDDVVRRVS
jgi:nitroreductase